MKRKWITLCLIICLSLGCLSGCSPSKKEKTETDNKAVMEGIVNWKKASMGLSKSDFLLQKEFLSGAGTSTSDWFVFAMRSAVFSDDYSAYEKALIEYVKKSYKEKGTLDERKATEWHRIGLTLLALGKDPASIDGIDFIGDGTYNRGKTESLDTQGLNAYIWALILMDAKDYSVPEKSFDTRESIKKKILESQMKSGAFGLTPMDEDIDITAMALCALAPYKEEKEVSEAIKRALSYLSKKQNEIGDFGNTKMSSESAAQVLVALTTLGIDPRSDERFIKEDHTVLDGLLCYRQKDGGFAHSLEGEAASNDIASEQALYALAAYERYVNGEPSIYKMK